MLNQNPEPGEDAAIFLRLYGKRLCEMHPKIVLRIMADLLRDERTRQIPAWIVSGKDIPQECQAFIFALHEDLLRNDTLGISQELLLQNDRENLGAQAASAEELIAGGAFLIAIIVALRNRDFKLKVNKKNKKGDEFNVEVDFKSKLPNGAIDVIKSVADNIRQLLGST